MDNNTLYSQIYDLFREVPNTNTIASGVGFRLQPPTPIESENSLGLTRRPQADTRLRSS